MQNRPAIVAVGRTKFGEHYGKEPEKLIEEAWLAASNECNIERKDLEACYMSDCFLPITNKLGLKKGFLSNLEKLNLALAQVSVKNHANATKNKYAQYQRKITIDQVFAARKEAHKSLG